MAPTLSVSCPGWHPSTPRFKSAQSIVRIHGISAKEKERWYEPCAMLEPRELGAMGVMETAPENSGSAQGKDRPGWVNPRLIDKY